MIIVLLYLNDCPECKVGKMKPLSKVGEDRDPATIRVTGDYREYKCNNCGYPHGGKQIAVTVNEVVGAKENQPNDSSNNKSNDNDSSSTK
jgi:hypothetical protein